MGRGQVVRHQFLVLAFAGSNPAAPAKYCTKGDRDAGKNEGGHDQSLAEYADSELQG